MMMTSATKSSNKRILLECVFIIHYYVYNVGSFNLVLYGCVIEEKVMILYGLGIGI